MKSFQTLPPDQARSYASQPVHAAIGVQAGEEMLRWIWENEFSAVVGDMPAFEALPFQSTTHWMHEWLLAGWGMPIGELFDLEKLALECKRLNKWSFFFSSVPLKVCFFHISVKRSTLIDLGAWRCSESPEWRCDPVIQGNVVEFDTVCFSSYGQKVQLKSFSFSPCPWMSPLASLAYIPSRHPPKVM